jgi:hypothetical protein
MIHIVGWDISYACSMERILTLIFWRKNENSTVFYYNVNIKQQQQLARNNVDLL